MVFSTGDKVPLYLACSDISLFCSGCENGNTIFQNDKTCRSFNFNEWAEFRRHIIAEAGMELLVV